MARPFSTLHKALLLSLAGHGLLLAWGHWNVMPSPSAAGGGLQVRLHAVVPASLPTATAAVAPAGVVTAVKPKALQPPKRVAVLTTPGPGQMPAPTLHAPAVTEVAVASHLERGSGRSQNPAVAAVGDGGGPSAPAPAREGANGDALRQYRLALALETKRFKRYPRLARERGWEGTVEVAVTLGGAVGPIATLQRSSGYALLDEEGLEMVSRAVAQTSVPEPLRGRDLRLLLPIQFSLND